MLHTPGDNGWLEVKEVCSLATEFCNEFSLPIKQGYLDYIEIGMDKMKTYSLNRFKSLHGAIIKTFEAKIEVTQDTHPNRTLELIREYNTRILDQVGYTPEKLSWEQQAAFVKARKEVFRIGIGIKNYIDAQFEELAWTKSIPDPLQLYGEKAVERAVKYCYKNNIKIGSKEKNSIDFSKIRKNGKNYN